MMRGIGFAFAFVLVALLVCALGAAAVQQAPAPANPSEAAVAARARTIVLVRHAEKDAQGDARDPLLSAAGAARARTLARMLAPSGVTHLFASEFHRTQDTLAPLASACRKQVEVVAGAKFEDLVRALDGLPGGSVAVVAGHSNTVPAIARHFGLALAGTTGTKAGPVLPDDAYDRLYVITVPPGEAHLPATLFEMRYGD